MDIGVHRSQPQVDCDESDTEMFARWKADKRIYCRGSSVNVWEPNVLSKATEDQEASSDTASLSQLSTFTSHLSEAWIESIDPIIALAAAPNTSLYCVSYESGAVDLFDMQRRGGKLLRLFESSAFLSVDHIAWGEDSRHIASADLGGNITVDRLDTVDDGERSPVAKRLLTRRVDLVSTSQCCLEVPSTILL